MTVCVEKGGGGPPEKDVALVDSAAAETDADEVGAGVLGEPDEPGAGPLVEVGPPLLGTIPGVKPGPVEELEEADGAPELCAAALGLEPDALLEPAWEEEGPVKAGGPDVEDDWLDPGAANEGPELCAAAL